MTPAASDIRGKRILAVDDHLDALDLLAELLTLEGADVRCARSGPEALEILASFTADVLVTNLSMPGMDGIELLHQARALRDVTAPGLPAVAVTGYVRVADRLRLAGAGFDGLVEKPAEPMDIVAAITAAVARR